MARQPEFDWYLPEWMKAAGVSQADLCRVTGWPKAKMSELVNGVSRYNRENVNMLAKVLHVRPYELLMPPDLAAAFKKYLASAQDVVTLAHDADLPPDVPDLAMEAEKRHATGHKPEAKRKAS